MPREITGNNYIATCAELIVAFGKALELSADDATHGTDEAVELETATFDLAKECGWDYENDEDFYTWTLKATGQEILVEGLTRALAVVRKRYLGRKITP